MQPRIAARATRCIAPLIAALAAALQLAACGGGGDDGAIPPFWSRGGVVAADFDSDGDVDVAVVATYVAGPPPHPGYVEVYLQAPGGAFQEPVRYAVAADPWGLSVGDFDGDTKLDLVAATPHALPIQPNTISDSGVISLLRQNAASPGQFLAALTAATGGSAGAAVIAQLTPDALADVAVADGVLVNGRALLLEQNAAQPGTLLPPVALSVGAGHGSEDIAVGDLDGDGRADIALAAYDTVALLYQLAGGGFDTGARPAVLLAAGLRTQGIALADLDGNNLMDIVTANAGNAPAGGTGGASVSVLLQTAPGIFTRNDIPVPDGARRVAVADFDHDTFPDIAVVSLVYQALGNPSRVTVLLQSATTRGEFAAAGTYSGPSNASFLAAGDLNGDSYTDIVLNDGPVVLLQRPSAPGTFESYRPLR
ncbi:MAG TPA: VCBS repeat-containing protein [Burkholderiales bacterium]